MNLAAQQPCFDTAEQSGNSPITVSGAAVNTNNSWNFMIPPSVTVSVRAGEDIVKKINGIISRQAIVQRAAVAKARRCREDAGRNFL
jgi:hypothetical protein